MQRQKSTEIPIINLEPLITPLKIETIFANNINYNKKTSLMRSPSEKWSLICKLLSLFGVQVQGTTIELQWSEENSIFMHNLVSIFSQLIGSPVYCQYYAGKQCWRFGLTLD